MNNSVKDKQNCLNFKIHLFPIERGSISKLKYGTTFKEIKIFKKFNKTIN